MSDVDDLIAEVRKLDPDQQCQVLQYARHLGRRLPTAEEIHRTLVQNRETLRRFGVQSLALFGSYSRNKATPDSDMDFIVRLDPETYDTIGSETISGIAL